MNYLNGVVAAIGMSIVSIIYPQQTSAEAFTGKTFLSWPEEEQRGYLDAQIVMASTIVSRTKPEMSQCMAELYYGSLGLTNEGFASLINRIQEYETFHPSSVLVAVIEKECGSFY